MAANAINTFVFADTPLITSQCISDMTAIYYGTPEKGQLVITADVENISDSEYVIVQVYANVKDISNPSNGLMNSFITMKMIMAKDIKDGKLNYTINYETNKLQGKCVVCLQIPNRGDSNDWVKEYMCVPFTCCSGIGDGKTETVSVPVGFPLGKWLKDNASLLPKFENEGYEISDWSGSEGGEPLDDETVVTLSGGTVHAIWAEAIHKGDLDNDGSVTVSDALTALRISVKLIKADENILKLCDINNSGDITVYDAMQILRCSADLITL